MVLKSSKLLFLISKAPWALIRQNTVMEFIKSVHGNHTAKRKGIRVMKFIKFVHGSHTANRKGTGVVRLACRKDPGVTDVTNV